MAIRVRRGLKAEFDPNKLLSGEPASPLDSKEIYIAFAPGDVKRMATHEDMVQNIKDAYSEIIADLALQKHSVKKYGAVGDGVTDDTAAIQACLNAAMNFSEIYFPEGSYLVAGLSLVSKEYVNLNGSGARLILKPDTNEAILTMTTCRYCTIQGLELDGNKVNQTAVIADQEDKRKGIVFLGTYFSTIRENVIKNCKHNSIDLVGFYSDNGAVFNGCDECHIVDNYIQLSDKIGLYIDSVSDLNVSGNNIEFNLNHGVWIGSTTGVGSGNNNIVDNNILSNDLVGLYIHDCSRTLISNNHIRNNGGRGIEWMGGKEVSISHNNIHLNGRITAYSAGLCLAYTSNAIIDGNIMSCTDFNPTQGYGLEVAGVSDVIILGNISRNNLNSGAYISEDCSGVNKYANIGM